ncbi:hypothetical protein B0H14DRAFT_2895640 [Mycena olivaceomarginata]|nr:hypothetical protein B0H14DRAFT_2895640 [Mycena olivaceomarginata]
MVLTRRAARAEKSIIRWLPNEILTAVMLEVAIPDLVSLCMTSRLIRNIVTPLLYRDILLSEVPETKCFLRTMKQRSGSLCRYVRRFGIVDVTSVTEPDAENSFPRLYKAITSVLFQFSCLDHLDLLIVLDDPLKFAETLLQDGFFPKLSVFRYIVQPQICPFLSPFLNRHPTITDLTLVQFGPIEQLGPVLLPNLISYNGPPSFIPSFNLDSGTISLVFLLWRLDDLDVDTPLIHLGRITTPPKKIVCLSPPDDLEGSTILESVARHLPDIETLKFRSTSILAHVSHEAAPEIMTHLKKFTALSVLEFGAADDSAVNIPTDRATILLCGEACKSLASITLNGRLWKRILGSWHVSE